VTAYTREPIVGDLVRWTKRGVVRQGMVLAVVPVDTPAALIARRNNLRTWRFQGGTRDCVSYLVHVRGRGTYWPTSKLEITA